MSSISNLVKLSLVSTAVLFHNLAAAQKIEKIAPGIWKVTYGTPEKFRPTDFKSQPSSGLKSLSDSPAPPIPLEEMKFSITPKGALAELKIASDENIYGFGLQVNTFEQRGLRREIRTSSGVKGNPHPVVFGNVGFSHAPMPFYISSKGYGVLINTSRYVSFYVGSQNKLDQSVAVKKALENHDLTSATSPKDLYNRQFKRSDDVQIVVDGSAGMEMLIFEGPTMKNVMERYNLFSGGGAIPPLWALGFKYRAKSDFNYQQVIDFTKYFRKNNIPCDMFGLEPGWHTSAYSCSYVWNKKNFPNPDSILNVIHGMNYKLNLWEHAYVHPTSPIFDSIAPYSANYTVWKGAVPDFITPQAKRIFADYHRENFLKKGISAFKLDECDAAYYDEAHAEWSFPDIAKFPSGMDGEQMRQIFGVLYQKVLWDEYRKLNTRTMLEVRASHLFAAPYGAAIYSDMYDHADYITMISNSGFSGVNWSPEVRETKSEADLIRRMQTILMSSHMVVDCWFLKNLPWFQFDKEKNNRGEFLPNHGELEQKAKRLIELRMKLIPYLYAAFAEYHFKGTPPFRPLVMDFPDDPALAKIDKQYMMGENIMCAPFVDGASSREVYFPSGTWYDFNTDKKYTGGQKYTISMSLDEIPMFVKEGTILPLAKRVQYITPETVFEISCKVYGNDVRSIKLFEDNSYTFDFEKGHYNWATLSWNGKNGSVKRSGDYRKKLYKIVGWQRVK